jgi:serine/threonine-protein kinase
MIMEYFEGQNLRTVLRRGPLPIDEAVEYLVQVCDALTEVHAAGIVHRDLKPANLLLTMRPTGTLCVKLLDFGIAKFMGAEKSTEIDEIDLTCDAMIGSLRYMSPEHIASTKSVDWRTDIWALGVTGYELLTGTTPIGGTVRMDIMANILDKHKKVDGVRPLRPECPPALENVLLRCLEKDRHARFQSAAEVARALREAMGLPAPMLAPDRAQMPSVTAPTALSVTDEPARAIEPSSLNMATRPRRTRSKTAWIGFSLASLLVVSLVFGVAWDSLEKPDESVVAQL